MSVLEMRPLSPICGVEVRGLDLSVPQPADVRSRVRDAWLEHHLVLVRGQELAGDDLLEFARWFGTVRRPYPEVDESIRPRDELYGYISNVRDDGRGGGNSELELHQDLTFATPVGGICMYAQELPESGGETGWVNGEQVCEALPAGLRHRLSHLHARHVETFMPPEQACEAVHPVIWPHPVTGRPILFVNRVFTTQVVELPAGESDALLTELLGRFDDPTRTFWHHWEVGDVVIWDNCALQHRRRPFPATEHRTLQRCHIDFA
jgi:taurine dioxygenase